VSHVWDEIRFQTFGFMHHQPESGEIIPSFWLKREMGHQMKTVSGEMTQANGIVRILASRQSEAAASDQRRCSNPRSCSMWIQPSSIMQ
jgi:hypothetical protein